jgi:hypothetical protein
MGAAIHLFMLGDDLVGEHPTFTARDARRANALIIHTIRLTDPIDWRHRHPSPRKTNILPHA